MKNTSWLKDNIRSIQSILWSTATIIMLILILTKSIRADEKIQYLILGNLFGLCMSQQGYYFGASKQPDKPKEESTTFTTTSTTTVPENEESK